MSVESMFEQLDSLDAEIKALKEKRAVICTEIALATCPYKVGEVVFSNSGLGTNGLLIHDIKAPVYTSKSNRWDIHTFAISKDGTVSQRAKSVSEIYGYSISKERPQ